MTRANHPETISNNLSGTAIYLIRRNHGKILYFNERVRESVPVISMSANTFAENIRLANASGMNDHIPKPLTIGPLADVMKKWMATKTIPALTV